MMLALAIGHGQETETKDGERSGQFPPANGRRLFTTETFRGNGRTCYTCHSLETGTVSPQDARERFRKNAKDPLFIFDGSIWPTSSGMNPTATIAAMSLRCADQLVRQRSNQKVPA